MPVLGELPCRLPGIAVTHGQALWVLSELGFQEGAAEGTFREYIKSLRKAGIPFATGEIGLKRRGLAIYSYDHLMELALALSLRVYHVVPDALLARIVRHREVLRRQYRYAYAHRGSGRGAPAEFRVKGHRPIETRGIFLDLHISFFGGKLVSFEPPTSLSAPEALAIFVARDVGSRSLLPINVSLLAEGVVRAALHAPLIRCGPRRSNL
jgi:hypothetical protein